MKTRFCSLSSIMLPAVDLWSKIFQFQLRDFITSSVLPVRLVANAEHPCGAP